MIWTKSIPLDAKQKARLEPGFCKIVKYLYEYINLLILCFGVFSNASLRNSV